MSEESEFTVSRDWKERLSVSRDLGTGFAAPAENLPGPCMSGR